MKRAIWVTIFMAAFVKGEYRHCAAAEVDNVDWVRILVEPQPSPLFSWRENLSAHLAGVDRCLARLRSEYRRGATIGANRRPTFADDPQRLKDAYQFVDISVKLPESARQMKHVQELAPRLKEAERIVQSVTQGTDLTRDMVQSLQSAQGFVKMLRHQLRKLDQVDVPAHLDSIARSPGDDLLRGHPAVIVESAIADPPAQAVLGFPLRDTLVHLSAQDWEARQSYVRRILEDEHTRLLEMVVEPGSDPNAPSYLLFVAKDVQLPGSVLATVRLPFRLVVETVKTDGFWNRLRILANTATDAGVVIRTSLLTEIPLSDDLSISAYDTCVSYFRSPEQTHRDRTLITFAASMELTFYRHTSSRIRDVSFRSIATTKSCSALQRSKQRGAQRACEELTRQIRRSAGPAHSPTESENQTDRPDAGWTVK